MAFENLTLFEFDLSGAQFGPSTIGTGGDGTDGDDDATGDDGGNGGAGRFLAFLGLVLLAAVAAVALGRRFSGDGDGGAEVGLEGIEAAAAGE